MSPLNFQKAIAWEWRFMVNCDHHHCIDDVCKLLKLPKISVIQFVVFWVVPYSLLYLGIKEVTCGHLKKKVFKSQLTLGIRVTRFHALFHALLSVNASPCLLIGIFSAHGVWKSQKKSHSTLRAKRATFTFWVDKS